MNALDPLTRQFTAEWAGTPGGIESVWLVLLMAFCLGQLISWVYMWTHAGLSYSRTFTVSLVVLPTIVSLVMLVMLDNIVVAFGLFAVFAVVRFRNIVKDTRDTSFVLWAIVTGIATGTTRFSLAVIGCIALALIYIYLARVAFGTRGKFDALLSLRWLGPPGTPSPLDDMLSRHAVRAVLASRRGDESEGFNLTYHLLMRDPERTGELLDELQRSEAVSDASIYRREDESEV
ncbi:MAG: DUF4956 domain-containing protein [Phycisphaeraceae bacterium]|nr:MAG: DUF4956 domain-containing protein [Phycisphaeraceae bacterium]